MGKSKDKVLLYQHPEEIFDRPYQEIELNRDTYEPVKGRETIQLRENGFSLFFEDRSEIRVTIYSPKMIRIQAFPDNKKFQEARNMIRLEEGMGDERFWFTETENKVVCRNQYLKLVYDRETRNFTVFNDRDEIMLESLHGGFLFSEEKPEFSGYRTMAHFKISEEEQFFGFGGRTAKPDRLGSSADMFNVKAGVVSGDYGGCAVPFFISTKGYGFFLNNPWPHVYFDMGRTKKEEWFFHAPGGNCDIFLFYGPTMGEIVNEYTSLTGHMQIPAKWMLGFWASSLTVKNAEELLEAARRFRKEQFPCDVLLIDAQWRVGPEFLEQYTTGAEYKSNDIRWHKNFGDKDKLIKELKEMHFKLGLHLNSRNYSEETEKYGIERNYLQKHNEETVANFLDEEANAFYQSMIEERVKEGVDIWWIDHSDRVGGEIAPGIPRRNLLGNYWCQSVSEVMERNQKENVLSFTRGSGIGGQKYGFPWPGDTSNGIEHFEEDLWFCMNAGLAGFPISSVDLGGFNLRHLVYGRKHSKQYKNDQDIYNEVFDDDNIIRRVCQSLLCIPVPRIHNNWCTPPKFPWNCNDRLKGVYKEFLKERYRLIPYYYSAAVHGAKTGEPMLRHLAYEYGNDTNVYEIRNECLLGSSILAAPITQSNVTSREVYLPKGIWHSMWREETFTGPVTIEADAPFEGLEGLPMFVKDGSIIARQEAALYIEEEPADKLILDYYFKENAELCLYESAEQISHFDACLKGECLKLNLENITKEPRRYQIRLHGWNLGEELSFKNCYLTDDIIWDGSVSEIWIQVKPEETAELLLQYRKENRYEKTGIISGSKKSYQWLSGTGGL